MPGAINGELEKLDFNQQVTSTLFEKRNMNSGCNLKVLKVTNLGQVTRY